MNPDKLALLKEERELLFGARAALAYSYQRCLEIGKKPQYSATTVQFCASVLWLPGKT